MIKQYPNANAMHVFFFFFMKSYKITREGQSLHLFCTIHVASMSLTSNIKFLYFTDPRLWAVLRYVVYNSYIWPRRTKFINYLIDKFSVTVGI